MGDPIPKCVVCGKPISPLWRARNVPVHSAECAVFALERLCAAEPKILDLLPPQYRGDLTEPILPYDSRAARDQRFDERLKSEELDEQARKAAAQLRWRRGCGDPGAID